MPFSMGRVLVFITQLQNLTLTSSVGFRVPHGLHQVRDLSSGKTRIVKQHRILRFCRENGPHWTVGIFTDGNYTGVELCSSHLLKYARIIFRYVVNGTGENVLVVDGIQENPRSDYLLRLRYFGWMRNIFWDKRPSIEIARSDSRVATKLRGIEAPVATTRPPVLNRKTASPARKAETVYYSSPVVGNESSARSSSRLSFASVSTNENKVDKKNNVGDPYVMMEKPREKLKENENSDGKLQNNVKNAVPSPQPTRRDEAILNVMLETPDNYYNMDAFVYGLLFGFALVFVVFVRVWIG